MPVSPIAKTFSFLLISFFALQSLISHAAQVDGIQSNPVPGGINIIEVGNKKNLTQKPEVSFYGKPVWVIEKDQKWLAIVGLPLKKRGDTSPYQKQHALEVNGQELKFSAINKDYTAQYLTVKKKHSNPNNQHWTRIKKESKKIKAAFQEFSFPSHYQPFIWPTHGRLSSEFGLQRYFNKQPRKPHSGLDIAAITGTDIVAPAGGRVNLVGDFFFNGNSVFIDHGQGLVSMYCHLDQVSVKQGQKLTQGELIGKVGSTGRVTGPHLHWTVSLNDQRVDPLLFVNEKDLNSFGCTSQGTCSE